MLILSRKTSESIVIDGRIHVKIVRVEGEVVKIGIDAPSDIPVHRFEVYEEIQRNNQQASVRPGAPLPKLVAHKKKTAELAPAPAMKAIKP
jgi:carbon storage regulator